MEISFQPPGVDRWEQHFIEKSRRRFEAERSERRTRRVKMAIILAILGVLILSLMLSLAIFS